MPVRSTSFDAMDKRLSHHPFTVATPGSNPGGIPSFQKRARAWPKGPDCKSGDRWFESSRFFQFACPLV